MQQHQRSISNKNNQSGLKNLMLKLQDTISPQQLIKGVNPQKIKNTSVFIQTSERQLQPFKQEDKNPKAHDLVLSLANQKKRSFEKSILNSSNENMNQKHNSLLYNIYGSVKGLSNKKIDNAKQPSQQNSQNNLIISEFNQPTLEQDQNIYNIYAPTGIEDSDQTKFKANIDSIPEPLSPNPFLKQSNKQNNHMLKSKSMIHMLKENALNDKQVDVKISNHHVADLMDENKRLRQMVDQNIDWKKKYEKLQVEFQNYKSYQVV